jgi:hypothetical protein
VEKEEECHGGADTLAWVTREDVLAIVMDFFLLTVRYHQPWATKVNGPC